MSLQLLPLKRTTQWHKQPFRGDFLVHIYSKTRQLIILWIILKCEKPSDRVSFETKARNIFSVLPQGTFLTICTPGYLL